MPFEIDMLNVGNADAIILRYIDENQTEYVVLIDAGKTEAHGKKVVTHIQNYTTKKSIDLAISTHPDKDHIFGFFYVIQKLDIKEFWIHDPKAHKIKEEILKPFYNSEDFEKGLQYVVESINYSVDLLNIIKGRKITIKEPLEETKHDIIPIKVLGPTPEYYKTKLHSFRDIHLLYESALEKSETAKLTDEDWLTTKKKFDKLVDKSHENNSSAIVLFKSDNKSVLFTSDVGPEALEPVIEKYDLKSITFLDVPHHGSKNNLSTSIMSELNPTYAFISCNDPYPSTVIVRHFKEIGTEVFMTKGTGSLRFSVKMPNREGWTKATPL